MYSLSCAITRHPLMESRATENRAGKEKQRCKSGCANYFVLNWCHDSSSSECFQYSAGQAPNFTREPATSVFPPSPFFPTRPKLLLTYFFWQMRRDIENTPSTVECSAPLHNELVAVLRDCICGLHYRSLTSSPISIKCNCLPCPATGASTQTSFPSGENRGWVSTRHSPL